MDPQVNFTQTALNCIQRPHVSRGNPAKEVKVSSHQYIQTCHQQHGSHNPGETGYSILEFAKGTGLRPTTKV